MNLTAFIIELVVITVAFTCMTVIPISINPTSYVSDFPPEIQKEYYKTHGEKKEKLTIAMIAKKLIAILFALFIFAWMAHIAGAETFIQGAITIFAYIVWIAAFDTFIIDWIFFTRVKKWRLPGTEHMDKEYKQKWFHLKVVLKVLPLGIIFSLLCSLIMLVVYT